MSLSTKQRIVKSYSVEFNGSHFVLPSSDFSQLPLNVPILRMHPAANEPEFFAENRPELREPVLLSNSGQDPDAILVEAELEAARILEAAEQQATAIRESAQAEIVKFKQEVAQDVQTKVIAQAQLEAGKLIDQAKLETNKLQMQAKALLSRVQNLFGQELRSANEQMLHLAVRIAEKVTRTSLAVKPSLILDIIHALEDEAQGLEDCRLHLSPQDAEWLNETADKTLFSMPWVRDEGLQQGDLFLECRQGLLDARIEAQLNKLEKALREELNGELGPACQEG